MTIDDLIAELRSMPGPVPVRFTMSSAVWCKLMQIGVSTADLSSQLFDVPVDVDPDVVGIVVHLSDGTTRLLTS